jgi:arylsulfatase A-like enzyme
MPNLDRLASEGAVFAKAYCLGAVCTPSRTSFLLGLNTRHARSNHFSAPRDDTARAS